MPVKNVLNVQLFNYYYCVLSRDGTILLLKVRLPFDGTGFVLLMCIAAKLHKHKRNGALYVSRSFSMDRIIRDHLFSLNKCAPRPRIRMDRLRPVAVGRAAIGCRFRYAQTRTEIRPLSGAFLFRIELCSYKYLNLFTMSNLNVEQNDKIKYYLLKKITHD